MQLPEFKLERYFSRYEFDAPYLMCCSDCESMTIKELLELDGLDALHDFADVWLGYTKSQGDLGLRRLIAGLYSKIDEREILVTSGAEEAIFIFMNALLNPGDHIIVQSPCYQSLFEIANSIGCEVTRWEMKENSGWQPELDLLAASIKNTTRAIIINSPHNPTGYLMNPREMESVVDMARKHGLLLFSDEVYRSLEYQDKDRTEAGCDLYENAVSLGVMSKSYGLAGLRIGWIATRSREIYNKMASYKDYTSICSSAPSEFLAATALRHHDKLVRRSLDIIKDNLTLLDGFFARYDHLFSWIKPKAGPIAFPSLRWDTNIDRFCDDLVKTKGL
ncbi:MAG: aminotransferase class I/II-fold pyridoxal phosphate-dependent enzyme, partial [Ignavibacteriales bacterium]